jgi:hypothetical protein
LITELTPDDAAWAAGLMERRRRAYDPGGPVFDADRVASDVTAAEIERTAAAHGAVLAVFPSSPGTDRTPELHARGWHVASDWYTGWPVARGGS